ncbi:MAG: hypothetical protein H6668_03380 [Ardenticatenaceae bacterium]|nr:hypothetical protein [Ardenticatenaceae bacterium]
MILLTASATTKLEQIHQTAQQLPDDASVRSNLTPEQAMQLRRWGEEMVHAFTVRTLYLNELRGQSLLTQKSTAVYAVMQSINQLMGLRQIPPSETDIVEDGDHRIHDDVTIRLLKNLRWLTGRVCPPECLALLKEFHEKRPFLSRQVAFHLLMTLLANSQ